MYKLVSAFWHLFGSRDNTKSGRLFVLEDLR
jgi:hypothetical protein